LLTLATTWKLQYPPHWTAAWYCLLASTWALVPSLTVTTTVYWMHKLLLSLSTVTIKNGGVTYVIGQDKIDDLYDDTQNGDVSVSGAMGGISYTLVADLDKDTAAVAASTTYTTASAANVARSGDTSAVALFSGAAVTSSNTAAPVVGDSDYTRASVVSAAGTAAVYESTSLKLSGAVAGATWSFTTTNKDDFGDAASKVTLGYAAGDALSFSLTHDTDGAAEAINSLSATYTMDAISLTVSAADDKDHARNTNTGKKSVSEHDYCLCKRSSDSFLQQR